MSDTLLQFVPADTHWRPSSEDADRARALAEELFPDADEVRVEAFDAVQLFVPVGFWDGPVCPKCSADLEEWWYPAAAEAAERSDFTDLAVVTPCCGTLTALDQCGDAHKPRFGRFVLEIMNPSEDSTPDQERQIAEAVGAPLNKVWVHM